MLSALGRASLHPLNDTHDEVSAHSHHHHHHHHHHHAHLPRTERMCGAPGPCGLWVSEGVRGEDKDEAKADKDEDPQHPAHNY